MYPMPVDNTTPTMLAEDAMNVAVFMQEPANWKISLRVASVISRNDQYVFERADILPYAATNLTV